MSSTPHASVLLPVRDASPWLEEAMDSILQQSFEDFEVLAVDDRSTDGSEAFLREWAGRDSRVRVLETQGLGGIVAALELARAHARGAVLFRMDADDRAPPERFAAQLDVLGSDTSLVACGTPVRRFPAEDIPTGGRSYEDWLNSLTTPELMARERFVECPIAHPTLAVRAEAMNRVGGYRDGPFPEDYDLLLRLIQAGGRLGHAECSPLAWRDHPKRLQRSDPRYAMDAFRRLKVEALLAGPLSGNRPVLMWGAGPTGKAFARIFNERGRQIQAFVDLDPRKIGQTIHGAEVIEPAAVGSPDGRVALSAVAGAVARGEVRDALNALEWAETRDFWAIA